MVIESRIRKIKWDKKIDPNVIAKIWERIKEPSYEQVSTGLDLEVVWEKKAKRILEKYGIPITLHPMYLAFTRQLGELSKQFSNESLKNEVSNLANLWYLRGLDKRVLSEIAKEFGVKVSFIVKFFTPTVSLVSTPITFKDLQIQLSYSVKVL